MNTEKLQAWSCEYEIDGNKYAVWIFGTHLEAVTHAHNLGLGEPELLAGSIASEFEIRNLMIN